ncbi:MAG: cobalt ECF transporter T component CbiQ [Microbacterium sp.]
MSAPASTRPSSALHRLPARAKVIALVGFALGVVAIPREWFGVYALAAGLLVALAASAGIRPFWIARRLVIELPLLVFVVLLPFVATGPRVQVGELSLSVAGLWGAWAILAKATLALVAALILVATTEPRRIVQAFEQLRLPRQLTMIMGFMLRYLELIAAELHRARIARASRGFRATGVRAWPHLGASVAGVFVRSHGRGERIHLAMLARGHAEPGAS